MRSEIVRAVWYGLGVIAMVLSLQGQSFAGVVTQVPEIDGSTLSAGLGLLAAGVMIVRSRMRLK
jgi:hypothetical protein